MSDTYLVVGIHGAPTPETAPHGFMWLGFGDGKWRSSDGRHDLRGPRTKWWPLPAPPTKQAPPPVPVARWCACVGHHGRHYVSFRGFDDPTDEETAEAADALNAFERDGVAWGPGRPMSELPDGGLVLVQMSSGVPYTFYIRKADYIATHRNTYDCWWPLPLPGETS